MEIEWEGTMRQRGKKTTTIMVVLGYLTCQRDYLDVRYNISNASLVRQTEYYLIDYHAANATCQRAWERIGALEHTCRFLLLNGCPGAVQAFAQPQTEPVAHWLKNKCDWIARTAPSS